MIRQLTPLQALERLRNLCARSEQCEHDLREKMRRWKIYADAAEKIIARLRKERFVDNSRFAHAYTRDKHLFSHWGRLKITSGLRAKRIDSNLISDALSEEIDEDAYRATALRLLRNKIPSVDEPKSYDGLNKLFRYAVGRGYEPAMVMQLLKSHELWDDGQR